MSLKESPLDITLLYVEDDEAIREQTSNYLKRRIKNLFIAKNGKEGLEMFHTISPDIIVSDIRMPEMTGLEMAREILSDNDEIPIIITTAFNDERYLIDSISIGIREYIKKPVEFNRLIKAIQRLTLQITTKKELKHAMDTLIHQHKTMQYDIKSSGMLQKSLLPNKEDIEKFSDIEVSFYTQPHQYISGDFLIIEKLNNNETAIMVIDVMGHGVTSALITIEVKTLFDNLKHLDLSPAELLRVLNNKSITAKLDIYFTAIYAIYDEESSELTIASGGATPVIYQKSLENKSSVIMTDGLPLGLFDKNQFEISEAKIKVNQGDIFVFQTDGLIESFDENEEKYDSVLTLERMRKIISTKNTAHQINEEIMSDVNLHIENPFHYKDDVTLVVLKKL
ncbi:MAG: fused response regulator/phosphatase [Nitrospinae bacterium]|nr:fused response regulator/phosphatase [Nitrospinota bacterium]